MRYEITAHDSDVEIHLHQTGEHKAQLLGSLEGAPARPLRLPDRPIRPARGHHGARRPR